LPASYSFRVRIRWVLASAIALLFMSAGEGYGDWFSPLGWVYEILFASTPWKVRVFDHVVALCLILALRNVDGRGPRVKTMRNALRRAAAALVGWMAYGLARGGHAYEASFQTYLPLSGILLAFAVAAAFRTPEHYLFLVKAVFVAAIYRAIM